MSSSTQNNARVFAGSPDTAPPGFNLFVVNKSVCPGLLAHPPVDKNNTILTGSFQFQELQQAIITDVVKSGKVSIVRKREVTSKKTEDFVLFVACHKAPEVPAIVVIKSLTKLDTIGFRCLCKSLQYLSMEPRTRLYIDLPCLKEMSSAVFWNLMLSMTGNIHVCHTRDIVLRDTFSNKTRQMTEREELVKDALSQGLENYHKYEFGGLRSKTPLVLLCGEEETICTENKFTIKLLHDDGYQTYMCRMFYRQLVEAAMRALEGSEEDKAIFVFPVAGEKQAKIIDKYMKIAMEVYNVEGQMIYADSPVVLEKALVFCPASVKATYASRYSWSVTKVSKSVLAQDVNVGSTQAWYQVEYPTDDAQTVADTDGSEHGSTDTEAEAEAEPHAEAGSDSDGPLELE